MTASNSPITEAELLAFVDGQLSEEEHMRIAGLLDENPEQAALADEWRRQNEGIRHLFSRYAEPRNDDAGMIRQAETRQSRTYRGAVAAAVLAALLIGGAGGFAGSRLFSENAPQLASVQTLPEQAQAAYLIYASEVRHPVEVFSNEEAHLAAWLGKRLDIADLRLPDLRSLGFQLVGGRLLPVGGKAGAFFLYEDETGKRLSVIVGRNPDNRDTSFRFASSDGVETFYWIDKDLGYAVSGEISRDRLRQVAEECYRQFPS
ncbi:anti-sigma factor [Brucella intermedia]|uniref:Anti-sigma factor n=1 Tax=Brucella intermedia GD04153 TaxID=2975438 RepID=A0AA42H056_9HYPH|nr:anti-sigma factor [Brucella intermedia]KAB2670521.1 anti-sigma factor [Ochrobactrum sp. LMG 5442]KAB2709474.1 anti-sigma factor [Brucella intermedia]MCO7736188.1 anti-sigma factor [Brucella intermedia]MDH0124729.1 anti-sigma factor [Brucella intermedia GD04153]MDL2201490.1 anti-sigma factor [Brucella intermedia]